MYPPKSPRLAFILWVVLSLLVPFGSQAEPPPYKSTWEATGHIRYEVWLANGTNSTWARDFKVRRTSNGWLIESRDSRNGQYEFCTYTNGLLYTGTYVGKGKEMSSSGHKNSNDYAVVVESNAAPTETISGINAVWLALASDCYLGSVTNHQYQPVWLLDDPALRRKGFTTRGSLQPLTGGLPRQMDYLNDGIIYSRSPVSGNPITIHAPKNFHGPVTNVIYQALSTTNISGVELPLAFAYQKFAIRPNDFSRRLLAKIDGQVSSLRLVSANESLEPALSGEIYFIDKRFEATGTNSLVMNYSTTNNLYPGTTSKIFKTAKKVAELNRRFQPVPLP